MDIRHRRFLAALGLFFAWVAVLAILAVTSARTPREARPAAATTQG